MYGHMNNTVSFTYFNQAKPRLRQGKGDSDCSRFTIVAVFFNDVLRIYTKVAKLGI
ncbi:Putative esterase OS=Lysinibacillus sphaericus OX=1421 GN=LYSIN_00196 PE=4 SV=1 [Lysinibacillus sphaericus]